MKRLIPSLILIVMMLVWGAQHLTTAKLEAEASVLREEQRELDRLRREHARLRQLQPTPADRQARQRDAAELSRMQRELAARQAHNDPSSGRLSMSAWMPAENWRNRGNADPVSTVETALWAAAGGDVAAMQHLIQMDNAARSRARELFERLPENARAFYAGPEHFVAALTIKAIPLGGAKLISQQQTDPDRASVWVFLRDSRGPTPVPATAASNAPPSQSEAIPARSAYVNLDRNADGWRLVVTASAVDKLAREQLHAR